MISGFVERCVFRTGWYTAIGGRYGGVGTIFMFHSVVGEVGSYLWEPMRCTAAVFEQLLEHLRRCEVDIVTLDAALERVVEPRARRFAVLTFDDGYGDNLACALPLLTRYGVPATIYVTSCLIERTADAWWLGLVEWLRRRDRITVQGFGSIKTATVAEKIVGRIKLTAWVQGDGERLYALREAMSSDGVDSRVLADQQALTHDELRRLAKDPLITIGGHTTSHPWLAALSEEEARREIADNRRFLQGLTQQEVAHFAYPYGSPVACGEREATLVAEAGFRSAVTSRHGCIFGEHGEQPFALPREGVHWYDDEASIACKNLGLRRLFRDLKQRRPWRSPVATMTAD